MADLNVMNKLIITKCIECAQWVPANSYGVGVYCDELGQVISETETDMGIPDICPLLITQEAAQADTDTPCHIVTKNMLNNKTCATCEYWVGEGGVR